MGLERKAGDYKELGPLTRSGRIAAFDEGALPMMAAVARSLDADDASSAPTPVSAPVSAPTQVQAPAPVAIPATASSPIAAFGAPTERMSPLKASLRPPATVVVAEPEPPALPAARPVEPPRAAPASAAAIPPAGSSTLSKVFERYAAGKVEAPAAPQAAGTPLKPLFDRLR